MFKIGKEKRHEFNLGNCSIHKPMRQLGVCLREVIDQIVEGEVAISEQLIVSHRRSRYREKLKHSEPDTREKFVTLETNELLLRHHVRITFS